MFLAASLLLGAALFSIGCFGVLTRRNAVLVMMAVELMLAGVLVNLVAFSAWHANTIGQVFALFVVGIAAAEVGVGLAIVMMIARERRSAEVNRFEEMTG